jgi:hypothetical protein
LELPILAVAPETNPLPVTVIIEPARNTEGANEVTPSAGVLVTVGVGVAVTVNVGVNVGVMVIVGSKVNVG